MMNNDLPRHSHCSENIKNSSFFERIPRSQTLIMMDQLGEYA